MCRTYSRTDLSISAQIPDDFPPAHKHKLLPLHDTYRPVSRYVAKITRQNVSDVVPVSGIVAAPKALAMVGGLATVRLALAVLPEW